MPRASLRLAVAGLCGALAFGGPSPSPVCPSAFADPPPTASIGGPSPSSGLHAFPAPRGPSSRSAGEDRAGSGSGGWWLGTAGIALALAAFGWAGLASRRLLPRPDSGPLQVVGRAALSPRHTVYLLRAGGRVLIVGAGSQGPPSLLGELTDPADLDRLIPARDAAPPPASSPAFDRRIGGES
jgi:flagellar protein FliO/FliZ